MLTSISPLGERARGNRWWITVTWLALGSVCGGAALGAVLGGLGVLLAGRLDGDIALAVLAAAGASPRPGTCRVAACRAGAR